MADPVGALIRQLQSVVLFGDGAPTVAPPAPRGIYIRLDGAGSSTLYVWEGSAWRAL